MTELLSLLAAPPSATGAPIECSAEAATELFDSLPPADPDALRGRYVGQEVRTGHPLDGVLASVSWTGKQFDAADRVHPILVLDAAGRPYPLNPSALPMFTINHPVHLPSWTLPGVSRLMTVLKPLLRARGYGAHLQEREHRGVHTAAMVYNTRPIVDVFRAVNEHTVLGMMEYPQMPRPYFFVLRRAELR